MAQEYSTTWEYEREIPQQMSTKMKQQIEWRRAKVMG